jgi:hypothetical protein
MYSYPVVTPNVIKIMSKLTTSDTTNSATSSSIETVKKVPSIPSIDALRKILHRQEARLIEAQTKTNELRAEITSRQSEQDDRQREIIAGRMLLSWINAPGKDLTEEEFKSYIDEFLDPDSPDRLLFNLDVDTTIEESEEARQLQELEEQLRLN